MNITEANAFNALVKGLAPDATDDAMHRALDAARLLGERSNATLNAGHTGESAREAVDRNLCVLVWGEDADLELCGPRPIETVLPAGGVL